MITRRRILATGLAGAAAAVASHRLSAADAPPPVPAATEAARLPAVLKFSSWYTQMSGSLPERLEWLTKMGVPAVELRETKTLPGGIDGSPLSNPTYFKAVLRDHPVTITSLDWSHFTGMVSDSAEARQRSIDSLKHAIDLAAEYGAPNIIAVPPRIDQGMVLADAATSRKILQETLTPLGALAAKAGTCILIEPCLRRLVNCLHVVADAAALVRDCASPGIGIVADFDLMAVEETNITGALLSGGKYVRQIHLSSPGRRMPGKNPRDVQLYREGFAGLKQIGYQGYCSFECGNIDTFKEQFASSMDFLRIIWSQV